jgi:3-deoxy-D-manno-octulosonate 8-phosphate phosphatase (KDO 8-P phosphatase)
MKKLTGKDIRKVAQNIRLLILDVDGVMTDGGIILDDKGNEYKVFHVRDGHGIKMLMNAGVAVAIITGRKSEAVKRRAAELGITEVFQKSLDKGAAYQAVMRKYGLTDLEVAFMGDDVADGPIMMRAGLPITVADAHEEVKKHALVVTKSRGGRGAVREITDFILREKGLLQGMLDEYFKV